MLKLSPTELRTLSENDYPTSDGKPMAETDDHRIIVFDAINQLMRRYAAEANTYVSGNLLLFYEEGNKRRHVSPDVFVVFGVKNGRRPNYLMREEGKGPDVVFEITSKTTRKNDTKKKFLLYQDVLKVKEYFLFDPLQDYLKPSMQGYRLLAGEYRPIPMNDEGRISSELLGLHLERSGKELRLWDPTTGAWLPSNDEVYGFERRAKEAIRKIAEAEHKRAEDALEEVARLRELIAQLSQSKNVANGSSNGSH